MHTMTGIPGEQLTPHSTVELQVQTEEPGLHGVWFNRGVYASQAYAERFEMASTSAIGLWHRSWGALAEGHRGVRLRGVALA
ncbi:hypothetical protein AB0L99_44600 [Streptomyces sp. NPDC051954]|uniref:hypothetical protein n=1 Tax=Streptomyces sp. NPDC051954 TaxID=3155524 RepID=UPI003413347F